MGMKIKVVTLAVLMNKTTIVLRVRNMAGNIRRSGVVSMAKYCCMMKRIRTTPVTTKVAIDRLDDHSHMDPPNCKPITQEA